jgi:hypothetical protein
MTTIIKGSMSRLDKCFNDWLNMLIKQAESNKDAAYLYVFFCIKHLDELPDTNEIKESIKLYISLSVRIIAAKEYNHSQAAKELQSLIRDCNDNGIIIPEILRGFHPEDHTKQKRGRQYTEGRDIEYARKIYELRKQEGSFPNIEWEIWEVLYNLSGIIDAIIKTDKGVTNQLNNIADKLKIPLSDRALQQIYLGDSKRDKLNIRRIFVIEDLATYCFNYWKHCYEWK